MALYGYLVAIESPAELDIDYIKSGTDYMLRLNDERAYVEEVTSLGEITLYPGDQDGTI